MRPLFGGKPEEFEDFHYKLCAYIGVIDYSVIPLRDRVETSATDMTDGDIHFSEDLSDQQLLARINLSRKMYCIPAGITTGSAATVVKPVSY